MPAKTVTVTPSGPGMVKGRRTERKLPGEEEENLRPTQGNWITLQAKLVRAAWREDGRGLEDVESGTWSSQEIGEAAY